MRRIRDNRYKTIINRFFSTVLCTTLLVSTVPVTAVADQVTEKTEISKVAIDNPNYTRSTALEVDGKPFWYNAIQIRIDKLADDPAYACSEQELQDLFNQAAADGFTVANSQIRWTDIQPNHTAKAVEATYVRGGTYARTNFKDQEDILLGYDESNESNQMFSFIKFDMRDMKVQKIDGAKIRVNNQQTGINGRQLRVYAIKDDNWSKNTVTWENAPGRGTGYNITNDAELVAELPAYDYVKSSASQYDLDITEYIKTSEYAKDGILSFVIQEVPGKANDASRQIILTGDNKIEAPELIYAYDDEFDFTYLDKAIDYAKNAGMKFEVLWFGTDTCSLSIDMRVPVWVHSNYQKTVKSDGTPLFKKTLNSVTGLYNYIMCKNDNELREKEAEAVRRMFEHIASRGDNVVIGFQCSNEPGVGLLHGSRLLEHCMCATCIQKKADLGVNNAMFREITMWEYNNNLCKVVKESDYPVWTRMNLAESADTEGVSYNERMRESPGGTYLDFIGIDHYRKTPAQLALTGVAGNQFAQGKNLPMVMELGQKDARDKGLYLAEDVIATLSGGAYVTIYDASSSDGCEIYTYNKTTKKFAPIDNVIPNLFKTNNMLKKIGYDLATKAPGEVGGNQLVYFNPTSSATGKYQKFEAIGTNKGITFETSNNGVGIAVNKSDSELALLTTKSDKFILNNIPMDAIRSAEVGAYDEEDNWMKEDDFFDYTESEGKVVATIPAYACVRFTVDDSKLGDVEETVKLTIEAENDFCVKEGVTFGVYDNGASANGWIKAEAKTVGDYVTAYVDIDKPGVYSVDTRFRMFTDRAILQLSVDGQNIGDPMDTYSASAKYDTRSSGQVTLSKGRHEFKYTITGRNSSQSGSSLVIALDCIYLSKIASIIDKSDLEGLYEEYNLITQESGNYSDDTWYKFQEELIKAKEILDKEDVKQKEIDQQFEVLKTAYENLLEDTDKSKEEMEIELQQVIDEAEIEAAKSDSYYVADIKALKVDIETAKNLRGDPAITAPALLKIVKELQRSIDELKSKVRRKAELLIYEDFENQTNPVNFGYVKGAYIQNGKLYFADGMDDYTTSVKKFTPEVAAKKWVEVNFDWTPTNNNATDIKSGIEFRDRYGRLLFALCAATKGGVRQLRYQTESVEIDSSHALYAVEPKWLYNPTAYVNNVTYEVKLDADFEAGVMNCTIKDKAGKILLELKEQPTTAKNLSKMVACNYYTLGKAAHHIIDNFELIGNGYEDGFPLADKQIYAFGNSIVEGHNYTQAGFVDFAAEMEGMRVSKFARNGASILPTSNQILTQIEEAPDEAPDYIVFEGGTNDAYDSNADKWGSVGNSYDIKDLDSNTFAGAFEKTIANMIEKWPEAKIVFVAVHKLGARDVAIQESIHKIELDVCKKWCVTVVDLYDKLDTTTDEMKKKYSFDSLVNGIPSNYKNVTGTPSGMHPNFTAIEEFYAPEVSAGLRAAKTTAVKLNLTIEISKAEEYINTENIYSKESLDALKAAAVAAKNVMNNENAADEEIKEQLSLLETAIAALELDKSTLSALIGKAEFELTKTDVYTQESLEALKTAILAARVIADKPNAAKEEIDTHTAALQTAIDLLQKRAVILEDVINEAEKIKLDDYTAESVAIFKKALEKARSLPENATLKEREQAKEELQNAIKGLVKKASKIDITKLFFSTLSNQYHTGKAIMPGVTIKHGSEVLKAGTDYSISYTNNINPGTATVSIIGRGSYTGNIKKTFVILAAKGKTYTVGAFKYNVTNASPKTGKVTLSEPAKRSIKKASIPAEVKIGNHYYKVTQIGKNAFKNCKKLQSVKIGSGVVTIESMAFYGAKKLKSVTIGKNVKTIKAQAFRNCKKLKTVIITSKQLKKVSKGTFMNISRKAVIRVPKTKVKKYKALLKKSGLHKSVIVKK